MRRWWSCAFYMHFKRHTRTLAHTRTFAHTPKVSPSLSCVGYTVWSSRATRFREILTNLRASGSRYQYETYRDSEASNIRCSFLPKLRSSKNGIRTSPTNFRWLQCRMEEVKGQRRRLQREEEWVRGFQLPSWSWPLSESSAWRKTDLMLKKVKLSLGTFP